MALMPFSQSIMGRIVFKEEFQLSVWIGGVLAIFGIAVFFTGEELKGAVPSVEEYLLPVNWGKLARLCAW